MNSRCVMRMVQAAAVAGCILLAGCVVAPPRARVAVVAAPARAWVPAHWRGNVWIEGHWRYR